MQNWRRLTRSPEGQEVPAEIYISLVDALYSDLRSLFIGTVAAASAAMVTAWKSGDPWIVVCALAILALGFIRALNAQAYNRARPSLSTAASAAVWEGRYVIGAAGFTTLLGAWCVLSFARTDDPFIQLLSFSANLAYVIGTLGRNFANHRVIAAQIFSAAIPMTIALAILGGPYYALLAFVLMPFFASLKFISDRLRRTLLDALIATRDVTLLAGRFDTALNNMPHGLGMFDSRRRLVVSNRRLAELFQIPSENIRRGGMARDLALECVGAGSLTGDQAERFTAAFEDRLLGRGEGDMFVEMRDGRTLALTFQPMENGGSVVLIEDISERKAAEATINNLARYDTLTGLPNRTFLRDQLHRVLANMRRSGPCAVLFVDLDQFKQVNDTLGHPRGDELLRAVAERLRTIVRDSDMVARFGGDEFVVLQLSAGRREDVEFLARRIIEGLGQPYGIDTHQVVIGASVGVAMAPRDGTDADLLLKNADMALYRAKSEGRSGWRFFEPEMDVKAQARRTLELDLRQALANDSFEIYFQPLFNLKRKRISTCEALLRWPHPERGLVSAAEFIPVAEELGLISELGSRVLRRACSECAHWPADVRVAVNISPVQFKRGNLMDLVREALAGSGLTPDRLELEITETVLLQDTEFTRVTLQQLRDLGVRVSLDDFGTGYSSLSYLQSFPFNKVKIDRSFLQGLGSNSRQTTLLRGVARLSADLGMSVTVEGVETEEQLAVLAAEDSIDEVQGYLFGAAIPGRGIRKLLQATSMLPIDIEKVA